MKNKDLLTYLEVLKAFEKRSTCIRLQVAAIIVKDGRIISTGWNGTPSGIIHCNKHFSKKQYKENSDFFRFEHRRFNDETEIHAEQNAIAYAARIGISTNGTDIITSISPCLNCAKTIIPAGIKNVFYEKKYDDEQGDIAIRLLKNSGVGVYEIKTFRVKDNT